MYRILFMGQKPVGESCLEILTEKKFNNIKILSISSNRNKNDVWWNSNAPYMYARTKGIDFIDNEKRHTEEIKRCIEKNKINFIISVGHRWIIDKSILDMVDGNAVNLHLAMLPMYQGNFTFNHAILNHEMQYGITLHFMGEQVDSGDYIFMPTFNIEKMDTAFSLYKKSVALAIQTFNCFVTLLESGEKIPRYPMTGKAHFYDRHSIDTLREIKYSAGMEEISSKAKAFYFPPFERAYIMYEGIKYYLELERTGNDG